MICWPADLVATQAPHDRYHLRAPDEADVDALQALFSDAAVTQHIPSPPPSAAAWKRWMAARRAADMLTTFRLVHSVDDAGMCGLVQLAPCPYEGRALMWGVVLAQRTWGTGLFPAVAAVAVDIARNQFSASALKAWIASDNTRARAAFGKLPGAALTHLDDTLCPDGRKGAFVIATIRF
jgi:RimJ/RimL family protein N-acetyltransferase